MSITTKTGDGGTTSLVRGKRVGKSGVRHAVLGTVDELTSFLGLARALGLPGDLPEMVRRTQEELFMLGAEVASLPEDLHRLEHRIGHTHVKRLEDMMSGIRKQVPMPKNFIVPGDTRGGAILDMARALARRLERKGVESHEQGDFSNAFILKYLNRLSDALYMMARNADFLEKGSADWPYPRAW
jgi:cob(I)alamin adenosyltransferase